MDSARPETILFTPYHQAAAREMALVAKGVPDTVNVCFLVRDQGTLESLVEAGVDRTTIHGCYGNDEGVSPAGGAPSFRQRFADTYVGKVLRRRIMRANRSFDRRVKEEAKSLQEEYTTFSRLFDELTPSVAVITSDRGRLGELTIVRLCKERGIPTAILPFALAGDVTDLPTVRTADDYDADLFPGTAKQYPAMIAVDARTGRRRFYYPPWTIVALDQLNMLPENPWVLGGGDSDWLLADGEQARRRFIRNGCDAAKIITTGMASHDILHARLADRAAVRKSLKKKYALSEGNKLILFAAPVYYEHGLKNWEDTSAILKRVIPALRIEGCDVLVSLHPKMSRSRYYFLEGLNCRIIHERLADILVAADLFVSSASSTSFWAALYGIPQIIISDGVFVHESLLSLQDAIFDDTTQPATLSEQVKKMVEFKKAPNDAEQDFVFFDGRSRERIVDFIMRLEA